MSLGNSSETPAMEKHRKDNLTIDLPPGLCYAIY